MNFDSYSYELAMHFVKAEETLRLKAYKCPKGVWTIGWGHTGDVKEGDTCTKAQADVWIRSDLQSAQTGLAKYINVPVSANQFIALLSLAYNMGAEALFKSAPRCCARSMLAITKQQLMSFWTSPMEAGGACRSSSQRGELMRQGEYAHSAPRAPT